MNRAFSGELELFWAFHAGFDRNNADHDHADKRRCNHQNCFIHVNLLHAFKQQVTENHDPCAADQAQEFEHAERLTLKGQYENRQADHA